MKRKGNVSSCSCYLCNPLLSALWLIFLLSSSLLFHSLLFQTKKILLILFKLVILYGFRMSTVSTSIIFCPLYIYLVMIFCSKDLLSHSNYGVSPTTTVAI